MKRKTYTCFFITMYNVANYQTHSMYSHMYIDSCIIMRADRPIFNDRPDHNDKNCGASSTKNNYDMHKYRTIKSCVEIEQVIRQEHRSVTYLDFQCIVTDRTLGFIWICCTSKNNLPLISTMWLRIFCSIVAI